MVNRLVSIDGECDGNEVPDIQFTNLSPKECYQKCKEQDHSGYISMENTPNGQVCNCIVKDNSCNINTKKPEGIYEAIKIF